MKILELYDHRGDEYRSKGSDFQVKKMTEIKEWICGQWLSDETVAQVMRRHGVASVKVVLFPPKAR
jgi:hypothetical protein